MKQYIYILLIAFILPYSTIVAQENNNETFKIGIALVPQYAITNTMRLDVDITLKNKNVITLSPMFSYARHSSLLFSYDDDYYYYDDDYYYDSNEPENISLTGGGLKATFRHFFGSFDQNRGPYIGGGLHYRYSYVEYEIDDWVDFIDENGDYITYSTVTKNDNFNQFGADFIIGYQFSLAEHLYGDIYGGWGIRLSDFDEKQSDSNWDDSIYDVAYAGYLPLIGLRIGIFL